MPDSYLPWPFWKGVARFDMNRKCDLTTMLVGGSKLSQNNDKAQYKARAEYALVICDLLGYTSEGMYGRIKKGPYPFLLAPVASCIPIEDSRSPKPTFVYISPRGPFLPTKEVTCPNGGQQVTFANRFICTERVNLD
jgi:hypothetical protein